MILTPEEQKIMNLLAEAWNEFNKLQTFHRDMNPDFMRGIHQLQYIVASRPHFREQLGRRAGGFFTSPKPDPHFDVRNTQAENDWTKMKESIGGIKRDYEAKGLSEETLRKLEIEELREKEQEKRREQWLKQKPEEQLPGMDYKKNEHNQEGRV